MTDEELAARLHLPWPKDGSGDEVTLPLWVLELTTEAADRIEELEAKLAKTVELLEEIEVRLAPISGFFFDTFPRKEIKAILAEIK